RGLGSGDVSKDLDETVNPGQTKAVGLVVDMVDNIMHGMQLGAVGMHGQVTQWCQGGYLGKLIDYLLDHDYDVWLTSDHGNIECEGKGRPAEGVLAEIRGARARVYQTPELRSQVASAFTSACEWEPIGLPDNYFPLVAGSRDAFVSPGNSIVGHGGITLEEVIVPLVRFERRTR
ncbi:MAG: PglZ domain-containing protein, partial [Gemmatimonadota bacterium]|nr:PglZ domain-containing protein [Gemmatimonadota bacterium]